VSETGGAGPAPPGARSGLERSRIERELAPIIFPDWDSLRRGIQAIASAP
jgi:hypothetical protein